MDYLKPQLLLLIPVLIGIGRLLNQCLLPFFRYFYNLFHDLLDYLFHIDLDSTTIPESVNLYCDNGAGYSAAVSPGSHPISQGRGGRG